MPDTAPAPPPDTYAAWRNRDFRRYAASWFLLMFSKMVETVAVAVYVYDQTDKDPLALGLVGAVQGLPVILLSIAGGQIADRFNRRRVVVLTLTLSTLICAGLLTLSLAEASIQKPYLVPIVYTLLGIGAVGMAIGGPSRAALLPQLVEPEKLTNAITWNSTVFHTALMTGPAVGGLVLEAYGSPAAFGLAVVCRVLAVLTIVGLRCRQPTGQQPSISWETVAAGVRFVWKSKMILAALTLDLLAVLIGGLTYLLPIFAIDILHVDKSGLGYLRSAEAVGAVGMAFLIAHLPPMQHAGRTMLWAVAGFGMATVAFGFSETFWLSMAMMFLIGAFDNVSVVVRHTLVQALTPDVMRGRVSAVNNVFIVASNDLGGLESGVAARLFGPVLAVVGGGIGALVVVLGAAWKWPELLKIGSLQSLEPIQLAEAREAADDEVAARG
jgi:MFS family permease